LNSLKALQKNNYLILEEEYSSEGLIPAQLASKNEKQISALFEGSRINFTVKKPLNIFIGYLI
jgi:hypothetical protein